MKPVFVLSFPRSRTAWLAAYLTGAGIPCFHEAWRQARTTRELRTMMEERGDDVVVNADCCNWFFLEDLSKEFPDAKYVIVERDWFEIARELDVVFGQHDWEPMLLAYKRVMRAVNGYSVNCAAWTAEISLNIFRYIGGPKRVMDEHWHALMHRLWIQVTKEDVADLLGMAASGNLDHLTNRMKGV